MSGGMVSGSSATRRRGQNTVAFEPTARRGKRDPSGQQARAGVVLSLADIERILAVAGRGPVALRNTALVLVMLGHGLGVSELAGPQGAALPARRRIGAT